jgi:heme/copper-type cytochrome/quinol oxidase subunit 1
VPLWSVRFQRASFVWLLLGAAVGAAMLASRGVGLPLPWAVALGLHADVMLFGWMAQFTMGTAYWMLPKHATGPERGPDLPMALAWGLLNLGVLGAVLGSGPVVEAGRVAEFMAVLAFAANAFPRIKAFGAGRTVE